MTPDQVRRAARSIDAVDEIGTWAPEELKPVYLTIGHADPHGPKMDPYRLFLRLSREELNVVVTALLTHHEDILAKLGVEPEGVL